MADLLSLYQLHRGKVSCFSELQRVFLFCFDSKSHELVLWSSYLHTNHDQYYCNPAGFNCHILRFQGTQRESRDSGNDPEPYPVMKFSWFRQALQVRGFQPLLSQGPAKQKQTQTTWVLPPYTSDLNPGDALFETL
jgi:hypothetical protein